MRRGRTPDQFHSLLLPNLYFIVFIWFSAKNGNFPMRLSVHISGWGHANRRGTQEEFKSCSSVWIAVTFATCSLGLSKQQTSKHHVWSRNKNFEMLQWNKKLVMKCQESQIWKKGGGDNFRKFDENRLEQDLTRLKSLKIESLKSCKIATYELLHKLNFCH